MDFEWRRYLRGLEQMGVSEHFVPYEILPAQPFCSSDRDHRPSITRDIGDYPQSRTASVIHIKNTKLCRTAASLIGRRPPERLFLLGRCAEPPIAARADDPGTSLGGRLTQIAVEN